MTQSSLIDKTGFWTSKFAEHHHMHSPNLSLFIRSLLKNEKETMLYDFGCGLADYLKDLQNAGFQKLLGIEVDPFVKHKDIKILKHNLTQPVVFEEKGNVISLEVGEHIPPMYQDVYIENITGACNNLLIVSWAVRWQGGDGHVNELNNDEVLPLFTSRGFTLLEDETQQARRSADPYCFWFRNTLFVLKRTK
jgi:hypothetical protein